MNKALQPVALLTGLVSLAITVVTYIISMVTLAFVLGTLYLARASNLMTHKIASYSEMEVFQTISSSCLDAINHDITHLFKEM